MKDKLLHWFGMDCFSVDLPVVFFLNRIKELRIIVYDVQETRRGVVFYAPINQRNKIKKSFKSLNHVHTIGMMGFIIRQFSRPSRIICATWSILLFFTLSHVVIDINYQATSSELVDKIERYLDELGYQQPFISFNKQLDENIKQAIKEEFASEIAWIEVTRQASKIEIAFNHKRYGQTTQLDNSPLIAYKPGMVVRFDVAHGNKLVKINDIVSIGEILVDNIIYDAYGGTQETFVEGAVWGYTWTTMESELNVVQGFEFLEPFHFLRLLYDCRKQIEVQLDEGEEVISESVLQFYPDGSTIRMKVHYTCLEVLTRP